MSNNKLDYEIRQKLCKVYVQLCDIIHNEYTSAGLSECSSQHYTFKVMHVIVQDFQNNFTKLETSYLARMNETHHCLVVSKFPDKPNQEKDESILQNSALFLDDFMERFEKLWLELQLVLLKGENLRSCDKPKPTRTFIIPKCTVATISVPEQKKQIFHTASSMKLANQYCRQYTSMKNYNIHRVQNRRCK